VKNLYLINAQWQVSAHLLDVSLEEALGADWSVKPYASNQLLDVIKEVATTKHIPCVVVILAGPCIIGWGAAHPFWHRLGGRVERIVVVSCDPCPPEYEICDRDTMVLPGDWISYHRTTVVADILSALGIEEVA